LALLPLMRGLDADGRVHKLVCQDRGESPKQTRRSLLINPQQAWDIGRSLLQLLKSIIYLLSKLSKP
jgi:hypothetical protein